MNTAPWVKLSVPPSLVGLASATGLVFVAVAVAGVVRAPSATEAQEAPVAVIALPLVLRNAGPAIMSPAPATAPPTAMATRTPSLQATRDTPAPTGTPGSVAHCVVRVEHDDKNDGALELVETTVYGAAGEIRSESYDEAADGQLEWVRTWHYAPQTTLPMTIETDLGDDGRIDRLETRAYDSREQLVRIERDKDLDGHPDYVVDLEYNTEGDLASEQFDYDGDGALDESRLYEYDEERRLVRIAYDFDGQSGAEYEQRLIWRGTLLRRRENYSKAVLVDYWEYHYNPRDLVARLETHGADGALESWAIYNYDEDGRVAETLLYAGHLESTSRYQYDGKGRISLEQHEDSSGVRVVTRSYDCAQQTRVAPGVSVGPALGFAGQRNRTLGIRIASDDAPFKHAMAGSR